MKISRCLAAPLACVLCVRAPAAPKVGDLYTCDADTIQYFQRPYAGRGAGQILPPGGAGAYRGMRVLPDGNIWATDFLYGRVDIYSPAGELLHTLDTAHPGPDPEVKQSCPQTLTFDENLTVYIGGPSGVVLRYDASVFPPLFVGHEVLPSAPYIQEAIEVDCQGRILYYHGSGSGTPGLCGPAIFRYDLRAKTDLPPLVPCDPLPIFPTAIRLVPQGVLVGGSELRLYSLSGELIWARDIYGGCTGLAIDPLHNDRVYAATTLGPGTGGIISLNLSTGAVRDIELDAERAHGIAIRGDLGACRFGPYAGSEEPAAPCPVDLNGDGVIDFGDYLEFLNLFEALDPRADFSGDGVVDFGDYLEFLNHFDAGC